MPKIEYLDLIGIQYKKKGRDPLSGLDCYGLLIEAFKRAGKTIPEYDSPDSSTGIVALINSEIRLWKKIEEPQQGAAALYRVPGLLHCAYLLTKDLLLHSWEPAAGVLVEPREEWDKRLIGYYVFEQ